MFGILASVAVSQVIGMLWYSPIFLGGPWMRNNFPGKKPEQISSEGNFPQAIILCIVGQACLALVLNYVLLSVLGVSSLESAFKIGMTLGALVTISDIPHGLFSCRSGVVFIIDHMYDNAVFVAMCVSIVHFG